MTIESLYKKSFSWKHGLGCNGWVILVVDGVECTIWGCAIVLLDA